MLKLIALDSEDLQILSAHCQDALTKPQHLEFDSKTRQFIISMNRFAWELSKPRRWWRFWRSAEQRRNAVLHFGQVNSVETFNLPKDTEANLALLALNISMAEDNVSGSVEIIFADNISIRVHVDAIEAKLADLGGAWQAVARPKHPL